MSEYIKEQHHSIVGEINNLYDVQQKYMDKNLEIEAEMGKLRQSINSGSKIQIVTNDDVFRISNLVAKE